MNTWYWEKVVNSRDWKDRWDIIIAEKIKAVVRLKQCNVRWGK